MTQTTAAALKARHRQVRERQPEQLRIRVHRALSWLARAEREADDPDARFLFHWIALNAAYAHEFGFEQSEREQARRFVDALLSVDGEGRLRKLLFDRFTGTVRGLIDNRFVFEPFWMAARAHDASGRWEEQFAASKRVALKAAMDGGTAVLLSIVLDRLYVLRNQLVHGGATWAGTANRRQIRDCAELMDALMPVVLELLVDTDALDLGPVAYPVLPAS